MTTPLIDRLNELVKQLTYLNEILNRNLSALPEKLHPTFRESISLEMSGIKQRINTLHNEINQLMTKCYHLSLDAISYKCNTESKLYLDKNNPSKKSTPLIEENN